MLIYSDFMRTANVNYIGGNFSIIKRDWEEKNISLKYSKFYYITSGECHIEIKNIKYTAKPGTLLLIPNNLPHSYSLTDKNHLEKYWFHFGAENLFDVIQVPFFVEIGNNDKMKALFKEIIQSDKTACGNLLQKAKILELTAFFLSQFIWMNIP